MAADMVDAAQLRYHPAVLLGLRLCWRAQRCLWSQLADNVCTSPYGSFHLVTLTEEKLSSVKMFVLKKIQIWHQTSNPLDSRYKNFKAKGFFFLFLNAESCLQTYSEL